MSPASVSGAETREPSLVRPRLVTKHKAPTHAAKKYYTGIMLIHSISSQRASVASYG
jgi:hypothetical protein